MKVFIIKRVAGPGITTIRSPNPDKAISVPDAEGEHLIEIGAALPVNSDDGLRAKKPAAKKPVAKKPVAKKPATRRGSLKKA